MMCALLKLLGVIVLVWFLFSWAVMRFIAIVGGSEYPEAPKDIIEDVPPKLLACPRCGHRCARCFDQDHNPVDTYHCYECGWIGPESE